MVGKTFIELFLRAEQIYVADKMESYLASSFLGEKQIQKISFGHLENLPMEKLDGSRLC